MDAAAHLRAQGWQGPGNGLRAGSLQRAILTSKKTDLKGLGAKIDESDQWWDNIFSKQLSNITVGAQGAIAQVNGGIQAVHPVAARNAHRKQFGEKSALEQVFVLSEVLKGSEVFIPLTKVAVVSSPNETNKQDSSVDKEKKRRKKKEKEENHSSRKTKSPRAIGLTDSLPSPPPSPVVQAVDMMSKKQMNNLSDKTLRKEARRLRRETRTLEKAEKEARREKRRLKKLKKASRAT